MAETGDWITPRLYGQPWFEKPVLYYWSAAVGFLLHLPAEWAARLPSAIAALAAALIIAWLAKRHYGGDARSLAGPVLLAPTIFATSVAAIGFARAATPDMMFSASIAGTMACAATIFRHSGALRATADDESSSPRADCFVLLLFGVSLGLAVLAKGPAALILSGGAISIWALATKQWRAAIRLAHPIAMAAFCIVAIPWYALCAARNPDFLRVFFWQHNFERYTTPMFQHRQPFWYFGPIMLLALLPWTVLFWPVAQEGLRREKTWRKSPGFFFACWVAWPVAFFSFSQSKLPGYILPAIPPLVLLCSVAATRMMSRNPLKSKAVLAGIGLTWVVIGMAAVFATPRDLIFVHVLGPVDASPGVFAAAISLIAGISVLAVTFRASSARGLLLCAVLVAASVEIVSLRLLPPLDPQISARHHAEFMRNDQHPDRIFTYQLRRGWNFGLNFYFRRELPESSPADPLPALVLTTPAGVDQIEKLGRVSSDFEEIRPGIVYVPIMAVPPSHEPH